MTVTAFLNLAALLITLAAAFGYVNHRWLRLPHTIGLVVIALAVSFAVLGLDALVPGFGFRVTVRQALIEIDFSDVLMQGMLSFLLFAGALHVNLDDLIARRWAISVLATVGVLMSTFMVGLATFFAFRLIGLAIPLSYCLVFGALISPTDPVAVLGILKKVAVPASLEAKIAGESLFNDGVGIVVFTILVAIAGGAGEHGHITPLGIVELFLVEAVGGVVLGLVAGTIAYRAMKSIDEYNLEILITLSLVTATYGVAIAPRRFRADCRRHRRAVDRQLRQAVRHERDVTHPHRQLLVRDRRDPQLDPVPGYRLRVHRAHPDGPDRPGHGARLADRALRPVHKRSGAAVAARPAARIHQGCDSSPHLGWPARRHLRRVGPVTAGVCR